MRVQTREIERQVGAHGDAHDVAGGAAVADVDDVARLAQQALAVQESDRELGVVAGRAHGDGDGAAGAAVLVRLGQAVAHEPDFERLFDRDGIAAPRVAGIAQRIDVHVPMSRTFHAGESYTRAMPIYSRP